MQAMREKPTINISAMFKLKMFTENAVRFFTSQSCTSVQYYHIFLNILMEQPLFKFSGSGQVQDNSW